MSELNTQHNPNQPTKKNMKSKKKRKRKLNYKNVAAMVCCFILLFGAIGVVGMSLFVSKVYSQAPEIKVTDFVSEQSSQIMDKDGNIIADVGKQIRTNVSYEQMPTSLIDAFVAVEDSRFFEHNGFDLSRFIKAMLNNIKTMSFSQGGSTLTMQLLKKTYFEDDNAGIQADRSGMGGVSRKMAEILLAPKLSKLTDKKTVLELYVNKIYYGGNNNIRGIQQAAEYYFNKDVSMLNLSESAMLAGVVNAPNAYNPFNNLKLATERRNTVLYQMYNHGYITKQEYQLAKTIKVEDLLVSQDDPSRKNSGEKYAYQAYIDTVIAEAKDLTGRDPTSTAMRIYTCMDPSIQEFMDNVQDGSVVAFPDELMEVGIVSMNNSTGEIVGIAGGRNYANGGSLLLNHATDQYKQPGSCIKTLLSYPLAFQYLGWSTSHVVTDRPLNYAGTDFIIKNANGQYNGQVRLVDAIGNSLNTPAIATLQELMDTLGTQKIIDYLNSIGLSKINAETFDIQTAIGGSNTITSVKEMAGAHSMILNNGVYIKPHTITKIEFMDNDGVITPEYTQDKILDPGAAYLTAIMEYQAVNGPYYNYMQVCKKNYQTFGKTGTSDWGTYGLEYNIPQGAVKDRWMAMSTTDYTNVIWLGYEKAIKDKETYFTSAKSSLNITGNVMTRLLDQLSTTYGAPQDIVRPDDIVNITHILGTYPYASPIEQMDPTFITTGEILKDYYELVDPNTQELSELNEYSFSINDEGHMAMSWTPYPVVEQLTVAEQHMDLSLSVGDKYVEAYGQRLFDYSWIFGPVRYKAFIKQGDQIVQEVISETESIEADLEVGNGDYEVCGFYTFENLGTTSNQICQTFTFKQKEEEPEPTETPTPTPEESTPPTSEPTVSPKPENTEKPETDDSNHGSNDNSDNDSPENDN